MRKVHGFDVLQCPCGTRRKVVDLLSEPEKIRQALERLGLPYQPLKTTKARSAQQAPMFVPASQSDGVDPPAPDYAA